MNDKGVESVVATDHMTDGEAEALRNRIRQEHIDAGEDNRWIDVGPHSVQSRQIQSISVQAPVTGAGAYFGDDNEPRFTRDTRF